VSPDVGPRLSKPAHEPAPFLHLVLPQNPTLQTGPSTPHPCRPPPASPGARDPHHDPPGRRTLRSSNGRRRLRGDEAGGSGRRHCVRPGGWLPVRGVKEDGDSSERLGGNPSSGKWEIGRGAGGRIYVRAPRGATAVLVVSPWTRPPLGLK
jgi:hypothetical protein